MCKLCYERAGSPLINNQKVRDLVEQIELLYDCENCGAGGPCHIVTDDWNVDDESIDFCIKYTIETDFYEDDAKDAAFKTLEMMKELTYEERISALAIRDKFIYED